MIIIGIISMVAFIALLGYGAVMSIDIHKKTKKQKWTFISLLVAVFIGLNIGLIYSIYVLNEIAIVFIGTTTIFCILAIVFWAHEFLKK